MTGYPPDRRPDPELHQEVSWPTPPPLALPPAEPTPPFSLAPRPFLLTRGRTQGQSTAIEIETQVVTTGKPLIGAGHSVHEHRAIMTLCREPLSVAEIAARLRLHLNVVRVLVSDLYAGGHVTAHMPEFDAARDVDTLRRVIRGLRAIS
ncbi:hypothetical protein KNE206_57220 [Kitasatospora sp. NE20-6]|uniref:DUF742 domain-containing protein n=1 Tax=Kitasatospora sp. NE20-6 TaxID=2859066 RepID=UPI0034DCB6D8